MVVAHPDDETFGLGSVIAAAVAEGAEVVVCCATRGEAGEAAELPEGADLGAVRADELRTAWAVSRPLMARWFAELERVRPGSEHLDLDQPGLGRPDEQVTTVLDIRPYRRLREQAIAAHHSQVSPFDGMPTTCATSSWTPTGWSGCSRRGPAARSNARCSEGPLLVGGAALVQPLADEVRHRRVGGSSTALTTRTDRPPAGASITEGFARS